MRCVEERGERNTFVKCLNAAREQSEEIWPVFIMIHNKLYITKIVNNGNTLKEGN